MKKKKKTNNPPARWPDFMNHAARRLIDKRGGFTARGDPVEQLAAEIVRGGEGEAFLKSARRGRSTQRQNLRYRLLREVEAAIGASVPRRREDRNTPEAAKGIRLELAGDRAP